MQQEHKLCVIAGAGPGMGQAIARRFAREGFKIALIARNSDAVRILAENLSQSGDQAIGIAADLTRREDIARAFGHIRSTLGEVSVLVYNAAGRHETPTILLDSALFASDLALSVVGALSCVQEVYPHMYAARQGSLLFTGGGLALHPEYGAGVMSLAAGKAALRAFVYALDREVKADGVRVGTVTIAGTVAIGTSFDPEKIADYYWHLHSAPDPDVEIVYDGKQADNDFPPEVQR